MCVKHFGPGLAEETADNQLSSLALIGVQAGRCFSLAILSSWREGVGLFLVTVSWGVQLPTLQPTSSCGQGVCHGGLAEGEERAGQRELSKG